MSRPRIEIDLKAVENAAADGLNEAEVAARLGISDETLRRRKKDSAGFVEAIKRGRARADAEVSNQLFTKVKAGELGAIVWYEKTRKGYSDRVDNTQSGSMIVRVVYERRNNQIDGDARSAAERPERSAPVQRGELWPAVGQGHHGE